MREAVKQCLLSCRIAFKQKNLCHETMRSPNENSRLTQGDSDRQRQEFSFYAGNGLMLTKTRFIPVNLNKKFKGT